MDFCLFRVLTSSMDCDDDESCELFPHYEIVERILLHLTPRDIVAVWLLSPVFTQVILSSRLLRSIILSQWTRFRHARFRTIYLLQTLASSSSTSAMENLAGDFSSITEGLAVVGHGLHRQSWALQHRRGGLPVILPNVCATAMSSLELIVEGATARDELARISPLEAVIMARTVSEAEHIPLETTLVWAVRHAVGKRAALCWPEEDRRRPYVLDVQYNPFTREIQRSASVSDIEHWLQKRPPFNVLNPAECTTRQIVNHLGLLLFHDEVAVLEKQLDACYARAVSVWSPETVARLRAVGAQFSKVASTTKDAHVRDSMTKTAMEYAINAVWVETVPLNEAIKPFIDDFMARALVVSPAAHRMITRLWGLYSQ